MWFVGRVGKMHCLKADGVATRVWLALLAKDAAVVRVGSVDLHGRLSGEDLHGDARGGIGECGYGMSEFAFIVELVAVVVAFGDCKLGMVKVDALANEGWLAEVEWCVGNRC